jgi:hypothetical protein
MQARARQALKDGLSGVVFVVIGLAFAVIARTYPIGSTSQMGPGYFPFVLGAILVALGGAILVRAYLDTATAAVTDDERQPLGPVPFRALGLILGAVLIFGLTVRGLGVAPAVLLTTLLCAFASRRNGPISAVAIAAGLTLLSILIFIIALSLRLPIIGPWLGG